VGGALTKSMGCMGWVSGNSLGGIEEFSSFTRFVVGDDSKISLWHDVWCGEQTLKGAYKELFSIVYLRDASVTNHLHFSNGSPSWNVNFVRVAHG